VREKECVRVCERERERAREREDRVDHGADAGIALIVERAVCDVLRVHTNDVSDTQMMQQRESSLFTTYWSESTSSS